MVLLKSALYILLASILACSAEFGSNTNPGDQLKNDDRCDCEEPHPNPPPPPGEQNPPCPRPPIPGACELRVLVKVSAVEVVRKNGKAQNLPIESGEVDLCALSKDFFGVFSAALSPVWLVPDQFDRLHFVIDERTGTNRVETAAGERICSLRLPPGPAAGLRFEVVGKQSLSVDLSKIITFAFDENDALHSLGFGSCQLRHPVGHYDLK